MASADLPLHNTEITNSVQEQLCWAALVYPLLKNSSRFPQWERISSSLRREWTLNFYEAAAAAAAIPVTPAAALTAIELMRKGCINEAVRKIVTPKVRRHPALATFRAWVNAHNRNVFGMGAANECQGCDNQVLAGLRCNTCSRLWHAACAVESIVEGGPDALDLLPLNKTFSRGFAGFKCLLCSQETAMPVKSPLMTLSGRRVDAMSEDEVWDRLMIARQGPPPRRRLPRSVGRQATPKSGRYLAISLLRQLAYLAEGGSDSAELLLLFAPIFFFSKGEAIDVQIRNFVDRVSSRQEHSPVSADAAWVAAINDAIRCRKPKKATNILLQGPREQVTDSVCGPEVKDFFPAVQPACDEAKRIQKLRLKNVDETNNVFTPADLRGWSREHLTSSGGSTGWTGALLLQVAAADKGVFASIARLWARMPDEWTEESAAKFALTACDGWMIRTNGKHRPICAPQTMRRVGSNVLMKRARPLCEGFAREWGQVGLSGEAHTLAYPC